jgi:glutathione peroxidase
MTTIYDFSAKTLQDELKSLEDYKGQVLLIVNVASFCGFTPQYKGLQALHDKYHAQGFSVLGFPCNQFLNQEPGDEAAIATFCEKNYGVTFPIFEKIDVNGSDAHPLYQFLTKEAPGVLGSRAIKWNFTKFLVARDGSVKQRIATATKPEDIESDIKALLAQS